ncbi:MAG: tetratricopeptide repeat protein [Balneolaceae bacterium]|nr:tetratricopeptide repeat protein [Balneolaceae bacterium]
MLALSFFLVHSGVSQTDQEPIPEVGHRLESTVADSQKVDLMIELGQQALNRGRTDSARMYMSRVRALSDSLDFLYGRQKALYGMGDFYLVQQKYDSARIMLDKAEALNPNPPLLPKVKNLLATAYRYIGQNRRAIRLYREALDLIDSTEARTKAAISQNMGDAYSNIGNMAEAFRRYHEALTYAETAGDSLFLATSLNNIGLAYHGEEKYREAATYLQQSIEISRALKYKPGELRATLNLANTRSGQARFEESENLYNRALELSEQVRPNVPPIQIEYNLGELYFRMGEYDRAKSYFERSLQYSRKLGVPQGIYYNTSGLGNVAREQDRMGNALSHYKQALSTADRLGNRTFQRDTHYELYSLQKEAGRYRQALQHMERYDALSDSIESREQDRLMAEYRTRLELARKDQLNQTLEAERDRQQAQIQLQQWLLYAGITLIALIAVFTVLLYRSNQQKKEVNRALESQKKKLEETNALNNKLFGIVAHDLRTPLSGLVGMMELFRDPSMTEAEMRSMLSELELSLRQNINSMENLLAWAKEQMSGLAADLEVLDAREITEEILDTHRFSADQKQISLINNLDGQLRVQADYDMLKLVMRNLVSNSIKFSGEGDEIVIDAEQQDGKVRLEVRDSGIGIPEELKETIFTAENESRKGTNAEKGSGLGLKLCKEFVEKQGGSVDFESRENEGTTFYITLPAAEGGSA